MLILIVHSILNWMIWFFHTASSDIRICNPFPNSDRGCHNQNERCFRFKLHAGMQSRNLSASVGVCCTCCASPHFESLLSLRRYRRWGENFARFSVPLQVALWELRALEHEHHPGWVIFSFWTKISDHWSGTEVCFIESKLRLNYSEYGRVLQHWTICIYTYLK